MFKKFSFIFIFTILFSPMGWSQNKKLCVCFEENNQYISLVQNTGKAEQTNFKIIKEEFESKINREREKYKNKIFSSPPSFYYHFYALDKPSIIELPLKECYKLIDLEEFRKENLKKPKETHSIQFIFLQKKSNSTAYLKWDVLLETEE